MASRRWSSGLVVSLLLALLTTLAACGGSANGDGVVSDVDGGDHDGMHGAVLTTPYSLADATLTDTRGRPFDVREELDHPLTLVFFGYSNCPDICQAVMSSLASAVARLDAANARDVQVWFVTTDPRRDTPAVLKEYLGRFDPRFEGLTGPLDDIVHLAGSVHVAVEKGARLPSGGYEVTHGTPVLGVREDGSVPIVWTQGTSPAELAADITHALDGGLS